jgi:hypothetical protein
VSGGFEPFLIARGERIGRVAPKHMAGARRSSRERGKSDSIDAFSVARAALKEGIENLPGAQLDGAALDIRLLVDHREDLIAARTADQQRLRWHLHDLWPELEIPAGALDTNKWLGKISRRLARAQQATRVRVARARASDHRAHHPGSRAGGRTRRAGRKLRAAAARRARMRPADGSQADRRDRRRRPIRHRRQARTHGRGRADPRLLGQHPTAAATDSSTARCIESRSRRDASTRRRAPTWSASRARARAAARRSAASNASWPAPSTPPSEASPD